MNQGQATPKASKEKAVTLFNVVGHLLLSTIAILMTIPKRRGKKDRRTAGYFVPIANPQKRAERMKSSLLPE